MEHKLTIELVPESAWYKNVRSEVTKDQWDTIRRKSYRLAGHKCEVCSETGLDQGYKWPVECHEIWEYNDIKCTQTLTGLISLCPYCHKVKHPGLASMRGESKIVIAQLIKVNGMSRKEATDLIADAFTIWHKRNKKKWTLDTKYVSKYLREP